MRILLLHNRYRQVGGEERAVRQQAELLRARGHEVEVLERSSAGLSSSFTAPRSRRAAAHSMISGGSDEEAVYEAVRSFGAQIVHAHNLHPLFGWRALAAAQRAGARTVLTLHNYRLFCSIGVSYLRGAPCHRCHGRMTVPALIHRCRGGVAESAVYATGLSTQLRRILAHADRLVVLSEGQLAVLREHGLRDARVSRVPGWVSSFAETSKAGAGTYALAAGRLVEEKGFEVAIRAAAAAGVPLVIAGEGPDRERLGRLTGPDARFTGWIPEAELAALRAGAAVVLAPSRWEEVFPFTVLDALAAGVPALVSSLGGLPELVGSGGGVPLPPGEVDAWAGALRSLWQDPGRRTEMGEMGLAFAKAELSERRAYERMLALYDELCFSTGTSRRWIDRE